MRKTAIAQSKKTVFLCDETKLKLSAPFNLVPIQKMDHIITNTEKLHDMFDIEKGKITVV